MTRGFDFDTAPGPTPGVSEQQDFFVRFWGVRGSIACPGDSHRRYGGNTSCLEVRCGAHLLVFDVGTGARVLGQALLGEGALNGDVFLTHTHLDHIVGLPFFDPLFDSSSRFHIWAGHLLPSLTLHQTLSKFMMAPLFPVPPEIFCCNISFNDFKAGETLTPRPGVRLRTAPLNHPNGATGYRIEFEGRSICYVTDTEHVEGRPDENVLDLIDGADIVIYDCTYTDEEFPRYRTWGHSTWQEGVRLCDRAQAGQLVIFHHDPRHDDAAMDRIAAAAAKARPGTVVAREGLVLRP
ncbi:MAG: MBL fold metallo-hydrolase [Alphaproteobacteria bacterium]|nr:MAG: MBL fold metallo-hydrolase [Alphaproteobacteria bacterium]